MGFIGIILSIITAIPEIIALVVKIIGLIKGMKNDDPTYTVAERVEDETELKAAVREFKGTHNATRLRRLHERIDARRMRRPPS